MGCTNSKDKKPKDPVEPKKQDSPKAQAPPAAADSPAAADQSSPEAAAARAETASNQPPGSARSLEVPAGRATNPNDINATNVDLNSTAIPTSKPRRAGGAGASSGGGDAVSDAGAGAYDVDENGEPIVLPKGDWVKTEGTPYYYSATENLYYHPPSCQFYDPTNEMWYDPEKDEWYHDDGSDEDRQ